MIGHEIAHQTDPASADASDDEGDFRFFDPGTGMTAGQIAANLGHPGMTLVIGDIVFEEDHLFRPTESDALFGDENDSLPPAFRLAEREV